MPIDSHFLDRVKGGLIVSCQASDGDAFRDSGAIARFARAALDGGACGIRANGADDIRAIREAVDLPIIGLHKTLVDDGRILITPTFAAASELVRAGADAVAVDCTVRGCACGALERVRAIRSRLGVPVMADIAEVAEAVAAAEAGADCVGSTMRGYTDTTCHLTAFEPGFIRRLRDAVAVPVLAEGRIVTPREAREALSAGAHAVIVGTAITRPHSITKWFVDAMHPAAAAVVAIDMGGTNTKFGMVTAGGKLLHKGTLPTPFTAGRNALLDHLAGIVERVLQAAAGEPEPPSRVGIATAGWVDPHTGCVVYATGDLPGWTDTEIAATVSQACGLPVSVENDANALAAGEAVFGLGRGVRSFICITLGTGVGGGCYVDGALIRGSHSLANALGHIPCVPGGRPCTCGKSGCLEAYANAAALLDYARGRFPDAKTLIEAANDSDSGRWPAILPPAPLRWCNCSTPN